MTFVGSVSNLIPGMMSLSVLGRTTQMIPTTGQYWGNGKKKTNSKNMIKGFTEIMIGTKMIKQVAEMVAEL